MAEYQEIGLNENRLSASKAFKIMAMIGMAGIHGILKPRDMVGILRRRVMTVTLTCKKSIKNMISAAAATASIGSAQAMTSINAPENNTA